MTRIMTENRQPGQIFVPGMAVGMLRVRRTGPQFEAHQADDVGAGIRQVIHTVGHNGNAAGQRADGGFSRKKQQVADDADNARQIAVGGTHRTVGSNCRDL